MKPAPTAVVPGKNKPQWTWVSLLLLAACSGAETTDDALTPTTAPTLSPSSSVGVDPTVAPPTTEPSSSVGVQVVPPATSCEFPEPGASNTAEPTVSPPATTPPTVATVPEPSPEPVMAEPDAMTEPVAEPTAQPGPDPTVEPGPTEPEPMAEPDVTAEPETTPEPEMTAEPEAPVDCSGPPPEPPEEFVATLDRTWNEMNGVYEGMTGARPSNWAVNGRMTLILDKVMNGGGRLDYCVRYASSEPVSIELRDAVESALERGANAWFAALVGYDCFPYTEIDVEVVGWGVADRATLEWEDDAEVEVFVNDPGYGGPDCELEYDLELRLTEGLGFTGFGEDWGQEVDRADYLTNVDGSFHIWLHEFGHGFGFPDYYDWDSWGGGLDSPNSVMVAGRAIEVTEWDTWMLRREYSELKSRWE